MTRAKQYRIQRSDHLGVVQRGWGFGPTVAWSRWQTVATFPTEPEARQRYERLRANGLSRTRVVYGAQIIVQSA